MVLKFCCTNRQVWEVRHMKRAGYSTFLEARTDEARFLNAGAGRGKLGQWLLVVSFGQPTVRFHKLRV